MGSDSVVLTQMERLFLHCGAKTEKSLGRDDLPQLPWRDMVVNHPSESIGKYIQFAKGDLTLLYQKTSYLIQP